ncbi:MAG: type 4a pilus biogenesis protein PilO [Bacillota bacterium]|nr:type 4a pilus biogenesis protein PilO [Bacillota bacterium]
MVIRDPRQVPRGLVMTVLCTLAVAAVVFLLSSQVRALNTARGMVAEEQAGFARAEARLQDLIRAKDRAADLEKQFNQSNRLLPPEPDENVLIADLQAESDRAGIHFLQIRFEQRMSRQSYIEMPFKGTFEGRYHNLLSLLAALREGPRALRIDEVKVLQGPMGPPQIRAEITASAFCTAGATAAGKGGEDAQ